MTKASNEQNVSSPTDEMDKKKMFNFTCFQYFYVSRQNSKISFSEISHYSIDILSDVNTNK